MADLEYSFTVEQSESPADDQDDLLSLNRWLNDREELDAEIELKMRPPGPGEMGGQPEAVMAIAVAAVPVAQAFFGWLREQVRSRKVSVTISDKYNKRSMTVVAGNQAEAVGLLPAIKEFFRDPDD